MDTYGMQWRHDGVTLRVEVTGERSSSDADMALDILACWDRAFDECRAHRLQQVLLISHLTGWLSTAAVYCTVDHLAQTVPVNVRRIAQVDLNARSRPHSRFAEKLAADRGLPLAVFDDEAAALRWLAGAAHSVSAPLSVF